MNASHNKIRTVRFGNLEIGGEESFPALNPVYVLNIRLFDLNNGFDIVKEYFNSTDTEEILEKAQAGDCDIIGLQFNIENQNEISQAKSVLVNLLPKVTKPLMISGSGKDDIDELLLPELLEVINRQVIVNSVNENIYKKVVPSVVSGGHILVLKSPIDINLAKELNILSSDMGLSLDNMIIDTDIGGLGYGLEYGYSIMEKIKLEGLKGDSYLNMPLISFAGYESLKTKEAKTELNDESWGGLSKRAKFFELAAASAVLACGADVIVMNYPPNITTMKGLVK